MSRVGRWAVLATVSPLVGYLLHWLGLPAGFLLGPMVVGAALAMTAGPVTVARPLTMLAQAVIGCMIARTITWPILVEIGRDWPVFAAGVLSVIAASLALGWLLTRWQALPGPTAIWGTSPGAAVAMTLMSGAYGADERLVAFMQYLRVVIVASAASILAALIAPGGTDTGALGASVAFTPTGLALTALLVAVVFGLGYLIRMPAGVMIVGIVLGALAQDLGGLQITLPMPVLAVSFMLIGWMIGLRFTRQTLAHALRALPAVLASILVLVAVCGVIAALMVWLAGVDPLTAYLATSPGGADTVAIIASSSHVDVAYVMAMQLARFLAVMLIGPLCARLLTRWAGFSAQASAIRPDGGQGERGRY